MDVERYRGLFLTEATALVAGLGDALPRLMRFAGRAQRIDEVFRKVHSLKGMAATMGFAPMVELAHQLEEVLSGLRDGAEVTAEVVEVLVAGVDQLAVWLEAVRAVEPMCVGPEVEALHMQLGAFAEAQVLPSSAPGLGLLQPGPGELRLCLEPEAMEAAGSRALLLVKQLRCLGTVVALRPPEASLRSGELSEPLCLVLRTTLRGAQVVRYVEMSGDWAGVEVMEISDAAPLGDELALTPVTHRGAEAPVAPQTVSLPVALFARFTAEIAAATAQAQRLDRAQAGTEVERLVRQLNALNALAQEARSTPLRAITDPLGRALRAAARRVGKRVQLRVLGAELRMERGLVDGLNTALTHVLNNAVDHGVESPEMRRVAGKPPVAQISLHAAIIRGVWVVEVRDDGRGVDVGAVVERAVSLGLLDLGEATRLAAHDLGRLLALPGLSGRASASLRSGRGVGLDAVAEITADMRGRLEVHSVIGAGTAVTLRWPRAVGLGRVMLVEAAGQRLGLPEEMVLGHEAVRCDGACCVPLKGTYQGMRLPRADLSVAVGSPPCADAATAVLLGLRGGVVALVVERVEGLLEVPLSPVGALLSPIDGLLGMISPAPDEVVFVVDPTRLFDPEGAPELASTLVV